MSDTATRPTSADLRAKLLEAGDKLRDLRSRAADSDAPESIRAELVTQERVVRSYDAEFTAAQHAEAHELQALAWDAAVRSAASNEGNGPSAALGDHRRTAPRSLAGRVVESDEYRAWIEDGAKGPMPQIDLRGSFAEIRALVDSDATQTEGNAGVLLPQGNPIPPVPRQMRLVLRDLIPATETTLANVPYVREYTPATDETGASSVAEGAAKPEVTIEFQDADAPIRKIAAWVPVTMEILMDAPTLRGYIDGRLRYMVAYREQDQFLRGNGVAPDLTGILNTTNVQTQTATNNDVPATIADSIAKVELADGEADGIVMNPGDFWASVSERRSTTFDGEANGSAPIGAPAPTLWGVPVVRTRAMTTLSALVGDFAQGALILDRMSVTVRQSDSHDTYFTSNKVAVLAEERVGLAVFRPDLFVNTTVDITA